MIAAVLGAAVIALAAASDFLVRSFWSKHAMVTSLVATLIGLVVTIAVVNEWLARRDRHRWSVLAQYVLFQLVGCARATWLELAELVYGHEIETSSTEGLLAGARTVLDTAPFAAATSAMLEDPPRRAYLQEAIVALAEHSQAVIARWASVMVGAGPFAAVFDRHVELQGRLDWVNDVLSHSEPGESRTVIDRKLARSSVATEHLAALGPDWLHGQLVTLAQLAVDLDYSSRALGFELVPLDWWAQRTRIAPPSAPPIENESVSKPTTALG